jgi:hypothetical protein
MADVFYRIKDSNNTEVIIKQHDRLRGSATVSVYADSPGLIQSVVRFLSRDWMQVTFSVPAEDASGRWAAIGHVGPHK